MRTSFSSESYSISYEQTHDEQFSEKGHERIKLGNLSITMRLNAQKDNVQ